MLDRDAAITLPREAMLSNFGTALLKPELSERFPMRLAVCSWSLSRENLPALIERTQRCGVTAVQLALDPVRESWGVMETAAALSEAGIEICSGMMEMAGEDYSTLESIRQTGGVRLDEHWQQNLAAARANAAIAKELGIQLVTFHAGFIPHDAEDPLRARMLERLREICDVFLEHSIEVAFETGQETAETLLDALRELDRGGVGVNFDPANMILYGMGDPIDAVRRLASRIRQVHIKDAEPAKVEGEWGTEVVAGHGSVDWDRFLGIISALDPGVDLVVEREAGDERVLDVRTGVAMVRQTLAALNQEIPR